MSYVEAGYTVVLVVLAGYALSLLQRERSARRRLSPRRREEHGAAREERR